jgi:glucose-1-phosphate thymidylyltransferase
MHSAILEGRGIRSGNDHTRIRHISIDMPSAGPHYFTIGESVLLEAVLPPALNTLEARQPDRDFHAFLVKSLAELPACTTAEAVLGLAERSREWWREHAIGTLDPNYANRVREELSRHADILKNSERHGILLLGGTGSRLEAYTSSMNKHLLPAYDQPVCFHSLAALMMTGARSIAVVTSPSDAALYRELLGDGSRYGIELGYVMQSDPKGIAHAIAQVENSTTTHGVSVALGDNVIYGLGLAQALTQSAKKNSGAQAFTCAVEDPFHFDVVDYDTHGNVAKISLKPEFPSSSQVLTGLLIYDTTITNRASTAPRGYKGEYQLHDVHIDYLHEGSFAACPLPRTVRWFDTGRQETLFKSSLQLAIDAAGGGAPISPQIVAESFGWISKEEVA